ncbi:MAG TPA: hypothetical protein VMV94_17145, partial [Phycisphaerae bacterium]|nr:hypothetical protein [Phycisphaerae bacterium]
MSVVRAMLITALLAGFVSARGVSAAPFASARNLVVVRCSDSVNGVAERVYLDEFDVSGEAPTLVQAISLESTGPDAITLSNGTDHDRHLHRSADGRFLVFAAYNAPYDDNPNDLPPMARSAASTPRTIVLVKSDGSLDTTTRLIDTCDYSAIRGAVTTDGNQIWIGGDNASGATLSGGTRYTVRGSSTTVNLSQVQSFGGSHTPDNVRDVGVFGNQLYNSSGSSSSIGKSVFQVGVGLPTSGSQPLTRLIAETAST